MTVLVDTNVLLDVLLAREPHVGASGAVWTLAERGEIEGVVSAISFNNVYYILRKVSGAATARKALRMLRDVFEPVALDERVVNQALDAETGDFEDAIQYFSAVRAKAEYLVTRDAKGWPKGGVTALTPEEFLAVRELGRG